MNSIKITNTQKLRILFMCKKLFPEYNNIRFGTSVMTTSKDYLYFYKIKNEMQVEIINIHWFELCLTWISQEIFDNDIDRENKFFLELSCYIQVNKKYIHPVDYLYEEFLKLKL